MNPKGIAFRRLRYGGSMPICFRSTYLAAFMVLVFAATAKPQEEEVDWEWMNREFPAMLDRLMPLKHDFGSYVAYRSNRDLYVEELEYSFVIGYAPNEDGGGVQTTLSAHVSMPETVSIHTQMAEMHRKNRHATASAIDANVSLRRWQLPEGSCPAVRRQWEALTKVSFTVRPEDVITLHPMIYSFRAQGPEATIDAVITNDDHPLVLWARATREELAKCIGR